MSPENALSRRRFFGQLVRNVASCVSECKQCCAEAAGFTDFFSSLDSSYTITRHYPRELFEDDARRLGIDIDEVGIEQAVARIFAAREKSEANGGKV